MGSRTRVALEVGTKRVFATALDWPGWCRSAKAEADALEALLAYAPRYADVLTLGAVKGFTAPRAKDPFEIVERLRGDPGTDFGVPSLSVSEDSGSIEAKDLSRGERILRACWTAFGAAAAAAEGIELRKGPRGGGRPLDQIRCHVLESDIAYISALGGKPPRVADRETVQELLIDTLEARARGDIADFGPRGGRRWTVRYAIRRVAWHSLDHAWEIQDRASP
jgi:hypothetical protein